MSAIDFDALMAEAAAALPSRRKKGKRSRKKTKQAKPETQLLSAILGKNGAQPKDTKNGAESKTSATLWEEHRQLAMATRAALGEAKYKESPVESIGDSNENYHPEQGDSISDSKFCRGQPSSRGLGSDKKLTVGVAPRKDCINWKDHLISALGVWYVPDFLSEEEEKALLSNVYDAPASRWVTLKNRRLQSWGGYPSESIGITPEPLPPWLRMLCRQLEICGAFGATSSEPSAKNTGSKVHSPGVPGNSAGFKANHVLVNEYRPGQGILAHQDGPLYQPVVAIVSLNSPVGFHFYRSLADARDEKASVEMQLYPRSLLVFSWEAYNKYFHGIPASTQDKISSQCANIRFISHTEDTVVRRGTRVSLTIRGVPFSHGTQAQAQAQAHR
mmetsp:Transcript_4888/g.9713  ORF Transcript_4888/g.9713 Transcript_4888/m.9713 type:complete len:388 (-) Transcript_4888:293-1456(-)